MSDRQMIADLLSALEYHAEQTRPIQSTATAIHAAREYLSNAAPAPVAHGEPVARIVEGTEVDQDGALLAAREIDWHVEDIESLPVGTKLYANSQPTPVAQMSDEQINKMACAAGFTPVQVVTDNGAFGRLARAVLAMRPVAQAGGEPVAWRDLLDGETVQQGDRLLSAGREWVMVDEHLIGQPYLTKNWWPVQRPAAHAPVAQPLTDEQIYDLDWPADVGGFDDARAIVRAIERAHKIGGAA